MNVRLKILRNKKPIQYALANKYFKFLGQRTKLEEKDRYKLSFVDVQNDFLKNNIVNMG